jgi:hypothetical protein
VNFDRISNGFNIEHLQKRINKNAPSGGPEAKRLCLLRVLLDFEAGNTAKKGAAPVVGQ